MLIGKKQKNSNRNRNRNSIARNTIATTKIQEAFLFFVILFEIRSGLGP
jgi:hypothetical protein